MFQQQLIAQQATVRLILKHFKDCETKPPSSGDQEIVEFSPRHGNIQIESDPEGIWNFPKNDWIIFISDNIAKTYHQTMNAGSAQNIRHFLISYIYIIFYIQ